MTDLEQKLLPPPVADEAAKNGVSQMDKIYAIAHSPEFLLLAALFTLGYALKKSNVNDSHIPWILMLAGATLGYGVFTYTLHQTQWLIAVLLGWGISLVAIGIHTSGKQMLEGPVGASMLKTTTGTVIARFIAGLLNAKIPDPELPKTPPPPTPPK